MNKALVILSFTLALIISTTLFPEGAVASIVCAALGFFVLYLIKLSEFDEETKIFLSNTFVAALLIRVLLATIIFGLDLQMAFGPDAIHYDYLGDVVAKDWWGQPTVGVNIRYDSSGWGMPYFVGVIYFLIGKNALAGQLIISTLGAATSVMIFSVAKYIFHNSRVARYASLFVAFFPAMIIWTSQLLKDGFIIFLLVLALLAAIRLQEKFKVSWVAFLLLSLLGLASLRFYIFFMVTAALLGGFVLGIKASTQSLVSRFAVCTIFGVIFSSMGILQISETQITRYGSLDVVQNARSYASTAANSGIDVEEQDVSTMSGALTALPLGLVTLFLAPFPWQVQSLTQVLTMPEMIIWWISLPFLVSGIIYIIRNRLRECAPILFFTLMLSLSYAVYQGNLGTLYRQRAQIQVFLLIFTAVGVVLSLEKRENVKIKQQVNRSPQGILNS